MNAVWAGRPRGTLLAAAILALWVSFSVADPLLAQGPQGAADDQVTVTLYHGADCSHCASERAFLSGLQKVYPGMVVEDYEVYHDAENRARLRAHAQEMGFNASSTPVTIIGDNHWVGFDKNIAQGIEEAIAAAVSGRDYEAKVNTVIDIPFVGGVDVGSSSLLVSAVVIGFVDGVNPCSLWVLSVLLAIVLHSGSRGRVLSVGSTFLLVTTAMYGLYMAGMYSALDFVGERMEWIRLVVAGVAMLFGLIHMKEFFWFKEGPSLTIDDAKKPGMYKRMRGLASKDKSLPAVLGGTVVLAVGVSLLETPCTVGLPMLWTSLLASHGVTTSTAVALFGVYMLVFLLDELVIFLAAVATLRVSKVDEKQGRALKLVSGTVMITLAMAMLFKPSALESVTGTVQVFVVAAATVAVIMALDWMRRRVRPSAKPT